MAWRKVLPMDERLRFIYEAQLKLWTITELCKRYGISRKTGYKWLKRFREEGREGLRDRSRRPNRSPSRVGSKVEEAVVALRAEHHAKAVQRVERPAVQVAEHLPPRPQHRSQHALRLLQLAPGVEKAAEVVQHA